ncbi:217_t:CDS:2, partial [Racocetra fulgida]
SSVVLIRHLEDIIKNTAKKFAINQIKLAKKLQDPELECKCWIYYSEGLIQLGKFKKAKMIIEQQKTFVTNVLHGDQLQLRRNTKIYRIALEEVHSMKL